MLRILYLSHRGRVCRGSVGEAHRGVAGGWVEVSRRGGRGYGVRRGEGRGVAGEGRRVMEENIFSNKTVSCCLRP